MINVPNKYIRGFTKFGIKVARSLQFLGYLRTLSLKFQKATSKIEVFLPLPCWLSQFMSYIGGFGVFKKPKNKYKLVCTYVYPYQIAFFWVHFISFEFCLLTDSAMKSAAKSSLLKPLFMHEQLVEEKLVLQVKDLLHSIMSWI